MAQQHVAEACMTEEGSFLPPPDSVLDLIGDLHAFELQLTALRRRAHQLAADRAIIQQQLQQRLQVQSAAAAAAASGTASGQLQQLQQDDARPSTCVLALQEPQPGHQQQEEQPQQTALCDAWQLVPAAITGSNSRSRELKRTAGQLADPGPAAAVVDREAKRQEHWQGAGVEAAAAPASRSARPTATAATERGAAGMHASAQPNQQGRRAAGVGHASPRCVGQAASTPNPATASSVHKASLGAKRLLQPDHSDAAAAVAAASTTTAEAILQPAPPVSAHTATQHGVQQELQDKPGFECADQSAPGAPAAKKTRITGPVPAVADSAPAPQPAATPSAVPQQPQESVQHLQEEQQTAASSAHAHAAGAGCSFAPAAGQQTVFIAAGKELQPGAPSRASQHEQGEASKQQQQGPQRPGQERAQPAAHQQGRAHTAHQLPNAPVFAAQCVAAFSYLAATAASLGRGDVMSLAAARAAARQPLPLVPGLTVPGTPPVLQLADAGTVRGLVQMLCPSLDALLALSPEAGNPLPDVPYTPGEPDSQQPDWCKWLCQGDVVPESQLLSAAGTRAAIHPLTLPSLKAACQRALDAALQPGVGGLRAFFWAVQQQLQAELRHGATARQDSQQEAAQVVRACVLSTAHVACCLVTLYNFLARGGQPPQQQQHQLRGRQAAAIAAAAAAGGGGGRSGSGAAAVPMAAAAGSSAVRPTSAAAAAGRGGAGVQRQQRAGELPLAPLSATAQQAADEAIAASTRNLRQLKVCELAQARQDIWRPLPTGKKKVKHCSVVIMPSAVAAPLVRMLCPALDALLALTPATAQRLQDLHFVPHGDALLSGWASGLNTPVPDAQLLSVGGATYALAGVQYHSFKEAVLRVLQSSAAAAAAAAVPGQAGANHRGLRGFFWGAHAQLRAEIELGVTSRKSSQALAARVVCDYVQGVAHVANLLVALHNLLLRGGPVLAQQQWA